MLNPLIAYLLKKTRENKQIPTDVILNTLSIDKTYLSKIENNRIIPPERKLKQLYHIYGIRSYRVNRLEFDLNDILFYFNKIYKMQFKEEDVVSLNDKIKQHVDSIYVGHLELVLWCYKTLTGKWDDTHQRDIKLLINSMDLLAIEEKNFFLLCLMFYFLRTKQFENYEKYNKELQLIKNRKWLGLEYYIKTNHDYRTNNFKDMLNHISLAKQYLKEDNNQTRFNAILQYEGMYYNAIKHYDKEIEVYNELLSIYKNTNQLVNYGVTHQNIASTYFILQEYGKAIPHYIEGLKYNSLNGPYFELAWCYYTLNDFKQCKKVLASAKKAEKRLPVYDELLEWLSKMLSTPNSKSCLNILLKLEKQYASDLENDLNSFIYLSIANIYKTMGDLNKTNEYLAKIIQLNVNNPIKII